MSNPKVQNLSLASREQTGGNEIRICFKKKIRADFIRLCDLNSHDCADKLHMHLK